MNEVKLNLGCGLNKVDGYVNIDNRDCVNPDMVTDLLIIPWNFENDSVAEIRAFDFLEHVPIGQTIKVIEEIYRILKPNGIFEHFTPSTTGFGAFQDPFHVSFWNINSWLYYCEDVSRNLYGIKAKFKIDTLGEMETNKEFRVYHTYGKMRACK